MPEFDSFEEWLEFGWKQGWISGPCCSTHDGTPSTEAEDAEWEDGGDPCIHVIRLYESEFHKKQVERNSPPAVWRATNRGWK